MTDLQKEFDQELIKAINEYTQAHIDISVVDNEVYAYYHSKSNSFAVTKTYPLDELGGKDKIMEYEDVYELLCVTD